MRHLNARRKLGKGISHRRALLRGLATSLILTGKFKTTVPRAMELRGVVERLVTAARTGSLFARRKAYSYLLDKEAVHKLFAEVAPRYVGRNGGYTRVTKTDSRHGDCAAMAVIEFVLDDAAAPAKKTRKRSTAKIGAPDARAVTKASKKVETGAEA